MAFALWGIYSINQLRIDTAEESNKESLTASVNDNVRDAMGTVAAILLHKDIAQKNEIKDSLAQIMVAYENNLNTLRMLTKTPEGRELMARFDEAIASVKKADNKAIELSMAGNESKAIDVYTNQAYKRMCMEVLTAMNELRAKKLRQIDENAASVYSNLRSLLIAVGIIALQSLFRSLSLAA
ncbi:MAG: MCP four helix bundle domain-containing protein [Syntrophobacteraceae bacterium]|nr:MCP four helix bundle domain-containing protein [Syntrophobacteraceae bacterium]